MTTWTRRRWCGTAVRTCSAAAAAVALTLLGVAPAGAVAWCDLPFKEVAEAAPVIALARFDADGPAGTLPVVELIRGTLDAGVVTLEPDELRGYRLRDGQLFVIALDTDGRPIRAIGSAGFCEPVSILPIRRGAVPARFRSDYDGRSRALPLDRLRAELLDASESASTVH